MTVYSLIVNGFKVSDKKKKKLLLGIHLFDYNHVCNLFVVKNDKSLCSHQKIHSKKLLALNKGIKNVGHDTKTVIFIFCKYNLTKQEESLLSKGFLSFFFFF